MLALTHLFLVTVTPSTPGDPVAPNMPIPPHHADVTIFSLPEDDAYRDKWGLGAHPLLEAHAQALLDGNSRLPWGDTRRHVLPSLDSIYARPHSRWGIHWGEVAQAVSGEGEWKEYTRIFPAMSDWLDREVRQPDFRFLGLPDMHKVFFIHKVFLERALANNSADARNFVGLGAYGVRDRVLWSHAEVATPMRSPAAWWNYWYTARELGLETGK